MPLINLYTSEINHESNGERIVLLLYIYIYITKISPHYIFFNEILFWIKIKKNKSLKLDMIRFNYSGARESN
jgi:hypothetical protein